VRWTALLLVLLAGPTTAQHHDGLRFTDAAFTREAVSLRDVGPSGLYRALRAELELYVSEPGFYRFEVALLKGRRQIASQPPERIAIPNQVLVRADTAGVYTAVARISGEEIYRYGEDGPYRLALYLQGRRYTLDTPAFRHEDFGQITGRMSDPRMRPVDDDLDGRFEGLDATVTVTVRGQDRFVLSGSLVDGNRETIARGKSDPVVLQPGVHTLTARFPPTPIHRYGRDGTFDAWLTLSSSSEHVLGTEGSNSAEVPSPPLVASQFEPLLIPRGPLTDEGLDVNADGLIDTLRLTVPVEITAPGPYRVWAHLYTAADSTRLDGAHAVVEHVDGFTRTLVLDFDAPNIENDRKDGPFLLDVILYDAEQSVGDALLVPGETAAYSYTAFSPDFVRLR
jgi:hypothetical protein